MKQKKSKNKATTTWGNCFDDALVVLTECLNISKYETSYRSNNKEVVLLSRMGAPV